MAKESKFGTFGGVYTPSLLTILGVIMYLRLPWVVGEAGLPLALGIIVVAHVISISTGLSISSIATDKSVGAGGPYYIVSRSLGLPIGGTLGLALFIGLGFSISLYIIGFCDSFLRYLHFDPSLDNIRIAGGITLVLLTIITLVSTAFAIKTQYVIFALIVSSLASVFLGSPHAPAAVSATATEPADIGKVFGIFFPAVTGFTAGVNMSGDLKEPKKAIPKGTMAAIATGFVVYVGLAVFLHYRVDRQALIDNPMVLVDVARIDWLVVGGIWGATLSSALGSMLGAPRILQAVSSDGILPAFLAKGYGKGNEPRNAAVVSFLIGASGILIGELDVIARIVSMVFLTTYGFLNISCAIESWASPDFRPEFRIPKSVSVLGAVTSVLVMIQLDLAAMAGAVALMAGLYAWLQRRQLQLESGDTWEGFWATLVRAGLHRLSHERQQHRNWRPNVLLFRLGSRGRGPLVAFAELLIAGNGLLSDFRLHRGKDQHEPEEHDGRPVGVFRHHLQSDDPYETIPALCRHHGFAGLSPNTIMLGWEEHHNDLPALSRLVSLVSELDYNQLIYAAGEHGPESKRIDVWWRKGRGNLDLALALVRFITSAKNFEDAKVRFLLVSDDSANADILRTRTRRILKEARLTADVEVINNEFDGHALAHWVERRSTDAKLTILGLPNASNAELEFERLGALLSKLSSVLLIKGSSTFVDGLDVGRTAAHSILPVARASDNAIADGLKLPANPQVQLRVSELAERYQAAVLGLYEHALSRLYNPQINLLEALRAASERRWAQLEERLAPENAKKQQKLLNRLHSAYLLEVQKLIERFLEQDLPEQGDALAGRIEAMLQDDVLPPKDAKEVVWVRAEREQFKAGPDDSRRLRRFKWRRRVVAFLTRSLPSYPAPTGALEAHYGDVVEQEVLHDAVRRVTSECHQLAVHLGKRLSAADSSLEILRGLQAGEDVRQMIAEHRKQTLEHFDELIEHERERKQRCRRRVIARTRDALEDYGKALAQIDIYRSKKRYKVNRKRAAARRAELLEAAEPWLEHQRQLFEQALLGLRLSSFQHRLTTVVTREREALAIQLRAPVQRAFDSALSQLERLKERLQSGAAAKHDVPALEFDYKASFDPSQIIERLGKEAEACTGPLPESVTTLDNDSIERLEEKGSQAGSTELLQLSVRPLVQFLLDSELTGVLEERLEALPALEQRAAAVGQDVARLIAFQVTEIETDLDETAEDFNQQMMPAVHNGIERLTSERSRFISAVDEVIAALDGQLDTLVVSTGVYELARAAHTLDQNRRLQRGRKAVTGFRGATARVGNSLRRASVKGLYRLSTGLVMARRLGETSTGSGGVAEHVMTYVMANSPLPKVLDQLPYYYRQLFLGQATLNENFWVGRADEVRLAKAAIKKFQQGATGCLVIQGERGSGKSALWQYVVSNHLDKAPVYRVHPKAGGSTDPLAFERALQDSIGQKGTSVQLLRGLGSGSVVVLDDFELWWGRASGGTAVVDTVLDLIDRFGDRCLFILALNNQAYRFLSRVRSLDDRALGVVECGIVSAETLKEIISLRHGSTGIRYELEGSSEEALTPWATARLFAAHFHYSGGLIGPALQAWITHITRVEKERIVIRRPQTVAARHFDELPIEQIALLLQLCLHKQLHRERLLELHCGPRESVLQLVASLKRMGLLSEPRQRVYEVNRFAHHLLVSRLRQRGLLT